MSNKKAKSSARKSAPPAKAAPRSSLVWVLAGLGVVAVIVVAVLASQGAGAASAPTAGAATGLPAEISVAEAAAKRQAGAFVLDVREPEEWTDYHIPGATLIPLGQLETRLKEVPRDKEVVVVCRSGNRSQAGRDILTKAGYTQVTSMAGGLKEWAASNLPTVTGP